MQNKFLCLSVNWCEGCLTMSEQCTFFKSSLLLCNRTIQKMVNNNNNTTILLNIERNDCPTATTYNIKVCLCILMVIDRHTQSVISHYT